MELLNFFYLMPMVSTVEKRKWVTSNSAVRVVYKHVCIYCIDIYTAFGLILVG